LYENIDWFYNFIQILQEKTTINYIKTKFRRRFSIYLSYRHKLTLSLRSHGDICCWNCISNVSSLVNRAVSSRNQLTVSISSSIELSFFLGWKIVSLLFSIAFSSLVRMIVLFVLLVLSKKIYVKGKKLLNTIQRLEKHTFW